MRVVEVIRGTGTGIGSDGKRLVRYELQIVEQDHENGQDAENQNRGWVLPTFGIFSEILTLEMEDGNSVPFVFLDNDGAVSVRGLLPKASNTFAKSARSENVSPS
jgi:hypothetical protein